MSASSKAQAQAAVSEAQRDAMRDMRAADPDSAPVQPGDAPTTTLTMPDPDAPASATPASAPAMRAPTPDDKLSNGAPVPEGWMVSTEAGRAGFYDERGRYRWPSGKLYWDPKGASTTSGAPRAPRVLSNAGSTERRVSVPEAKLLDMARTLQDAQARLEEGAPVDPAVLGALATGLVALVNPLKARLPELEAQLGDAEIALAEAQLTLARCEAIHMRAKRADGPESPAALAAGDSVTVASAEVDRLTRERNSIRADYTRASR